MHPRTGHESPEGECRYSSTLSFTSALERSSGKRYFPAASSRVIIPVPIVRETGWAAGPIWTGVENLALPGFDPHTVQIVATRALSVKLSWLLTLLSRLTHAVMYFLRQQFHNTKKCESSNYFANLIVLVGNTSKTQRKMGSPLFWDFMQLGLVVSYRRFGKTYLSHLPGSSNPRRLLDCLTPEDSLFRNIGN
jgi:hypothetical protein